MMKKSQAEAAEELEDKTTRGNRNSSINAKTRCTSQFQDGGTGRDLLCQVGGVGIPGNRRLRRTGSVILMSDGLSHKTSKSYFVDVVFSFCDK